MPGERYFTSIIAPLPLLRLGQYSRQQAPGVFSVSCSSQPALPNGSRRIYGEHHQPSSNKYASITSAICAMASWEIIGMANHSLRQNGVGPGELRAVLSLFSPVEA